jgi:HEAT repeat protein
MGTALAEIIELAKDHNWKVCQAAAEALLTLSDHSKMENITMLVLVLLMMIIVEFRPSIGTAISGFAKLLRDGSRKLYQATVTLSTLSERGKIANFSGGLLSRLS